MANTQDIKSHILIYVIKLIKSLYRIKFTIIGLIICGVVIRTFHDKGYFNIIIFICGIVLAFVGSKELKSILNEVSKKGELVYYKKLSSDILSERMLKCIHSKLDLIKLIDKYYSSKNNNKYEKICIQNDIDNIIDKSFLTKYLTITTVIITTAIFLFNTVDAQESKLRSSYEAEIQSMRNRREDYYSKIIELNSKIKFETDENSKKQMEDYVHSLKDEMSNLGKSIDCEYNNELNIYFFDGINYIYLIGGYIVSVYLFIWIEHSSYLRRLTKKQYLIMKINIINLVIEKADSRDKNHSLEDTY